MKDLLSKHGCILMGIMQTFKDVINYTLWLMAKPEFAEVGTFKGRPVGF